MRQRAVDRITGKLDEIAKRMEWLARDAMSSRQTQFDLIERDVKEIQPATVDLTQELADDIVRKIHGPLTISPEFSRWVAEQGKFHDCFYTFAIGFGSDAGRGEMRLKGDGSMQLALRDLNGATLWHGTFVPADYGKAT